MEPKTYKIIGYSALGLLVLAGGGIAVNEYMKNKSAKTDGGKGSGSGGTSLEEKQKCEVILATLGRGGSTVSAAEIARCKAMAGTPQVGGSRGNAAAATQGRGVDGTYFAFHKSQYD